MGDDVRARLGEGELEALVEIIASAPMHKKAAFVIDEVERILAARAAAPDGLREAVEGLAAEYDREADVICPRGQYDTKDKAWRVASVRRRVADDLRAILAAHPAPGGGA